MQQKPSLLTIISLVTFIALLLVLVLGIFPFTDNFILQSKTYALFAFTGIVGLLYAVKSFANKAIPLLWSPLTAPVLFIGSSSLASSLLASSYPQDSLFGFGGVLVAASVIVFLGSALLPKNAAGVLLKSLGIAGVLLTISSALQLTGYGPSKALESVFGLALPHTIVFNLAGSSLIAVQVLVVAVVGLVGSIIYSRHISKFAAVTIPILLIGLALYTWSMLPGKPSTPTLPSFKAGWSIALDTIREPRSALIGVGSAAYSNAYLRFKPLWVNGTPSWNIQFSQAANAPLYFLSIGGFIGLASWIFLFTRLFARKQRKAGDTGALAAIIACAVLQLILPLNVVLVGIQFVLLAAYLASDQTANRLQLKAPTLSLVNEKPHETQVSNAVAPIYIVALVLAIGFGTLLYFTGKSYAAETAIHQGTLAAQKNDGIAVYNQHQRAVTLNPYSDTLRRQYALTNMLVAAALSNKTDATEAEKAQVGQLMQQAVREARSATTLDPTDAQNWSVLAQIYQNMIGLSDQASEFAVQSYVSAIENDPTNPSLRLSLGGLFLNEKKFQQAATLFQQAAELKPDFPSAHYNLAVALVQLNQLEAARASYQQVLALLDPDSDDYMQVNGELEKLETALAEQAKQNESTQVIEGQGAAVPSITDQNITNSGQRIAQPAEDDVQFPPEADLNPSATQ